MKVSENGGFSTLFDCENSKLKKHLSIRKLEKRFKKSVTDAYQKYAVQWCKVTNIFQLKWTVKGH